MSNGLPRFGADAPAAVIGAALMEHGAAVVDGVLDRDTLDAFNREIDEQMVEDEATRKYVNDIVAAHQGGVTRKLSGVAGKSEVFRSKILCHEVFVAMCEYVLRPNCATYQLNFADIMERGPGASAQGLHRDGDTWPYLPTPFAEIEFASMIALSEFSEEMGATVIVPGSHRWQRDRQASASERVVAAMEPGSAVLYLGGTIHAGGANRSNRWRRGMHLSYCLGWLRTQDNHYLTTPLEIVRTLPRAQQAMLGYSVHDGIEKHGGFLGAVNWRDPLDLLAEGKL